MNHLKAESNIATKKPRLIAIIGLMGVGKTTLGSKLADRLGYYFVDLDREIEDFEKKSIKEIFASKSEKYFREVERKLAKEIIARDENIILSLGGGAFIDEEIRNALLEKALTIWLKAPIDVILHRLGNKSNRPLLNNVNKREVLEELALKRYPIYQLADLEFDTSIGGYDVVIEKILNILEKK